MKKIKSLIDRFLIFPNAIIAMCVILLMLLFTLFIFSPEENNSKIHNLILQNGQPVSCKIERKYCGVFLYDCEDGTSYQCVTNLHVIK